MLLQKQILLPYVPPVVLPMAGIAPATYLRLILQFLQVVSSGIADTGVV